MVSALLLILHYKELALLAPCHCASCVVGIVGDLCIIVGVQYALQVVRFVHYCKLCITGNWLHLLGGFRQEGRVRCHQERVCPSSRPLILQRVFKREKCWMSWFSFHNLSRIFNCVTRLLILITVIVIVICIVFGYVCPSLSLSEDGYDDADAHKHKWTLRQDEGIDDDDDDDNDGVLDDEEGDDKDILWLVGVWEDGFLLACDVNSSGEWLGMGAWGPIPM